MLSALGIEVYSSNRYFTVTGNVIDAQHTQIVDGQALLDEFESHFRPTGVAGGSGAAASGETVGPTTDGDRQLGLSDEEVLAIAQRDPGFGKRYNFAWTGKENPKVDWSKLHMQLVGDLDMISGDPEQVKRLILASPLVQRSAAKGNETRVAKFLRVLPDELRKARRDTT